MKTIPFNLERAKAGDPILLNGEPAKFIAHIPEAHEEMQVIVLGRDSKIYTYTEGGRAFKDSINASLTMAPKKRVVWANMYQKCEFAWVHESKELADRRAEPDRIACVRVEFEEGEGL